VYFNSGDLLIRSSEGFYYWSDRVGDTFRWKGEVSGGAMCVCAVGMCVHRCKLCVLHLCALCFIE
jgi:hypothetical protein